MTSEICISAATGAGGWRARHHHRQRRGLGVRDMNVRLADLDLDAVRPYLDTLPFCGQGDRQAGWLRVSQRTGPQPGVGLPDAAVPGNPLTTIAGEGGVGAARDSGLTFTNFGVRQSDIDLRTVRRIAPAVFSQAGSWLWAASTAHSATSSSMEPPNIRMGTCLPACSKEPFTSIPDSGARARY